MAKNKIENLEVVAKSTEKKAAKPRVKKAKTVESEAIVLPPYDIEANKKLAKKYTKWQLGQMLRLPDYNTVMKSKLIEVALAGRFDFTSAPKPTTPNKKFAQIIF